MWYPPRLTTGILAAIRDCRAVLVAKIGDGPTEKLSAVGVAGSHAEHPATGTPHLGAGQPEPYQN